MKQRKGLDYCIDFDTREMPGKVVAVRVSLDKKIMTETDSIRVDLCDHPLYPKLAAYVMANPPPKRPKG